MCAPTAPQWWQLVERPRLDTFSIIAKMIKAGVGWLWADGFDPEELRYGAIISMEGELSVRPAPM